MAAEVFAEESSAHSARLLSHACAVHGVAPNHLVLHADNGAPMKGATLLATLHKLGVVPSFSRPAVSDDNPYSEALFRTMKYRPDYPQAAFENLEQAQSWVDGFVFWYNTQHLHSAICFVSPDDRHYGREGDHLGQAQGALRACPAAEPQPVDDKCSQLGAGDSGVAESEQKGERAPYQPAEKGGLEIRFGSSNPGDSHPPGPHRSVREPLDSYGSYHPAVRLPV